MSFSSLLSVLLLSSAATAAAVVNHNPATVTARAVATPRMHIERDAQGGGFEGINILGLGHLVGIDPDAQFSSIMIDGKTYPTFEVGGTLYPYNLTLPILGDLINKVDGTLKLTYTSVNGVVLLDFILKVSQNETEHLTIPGIFNFSDGTGTRATAQGEDQGIVSIDFASGVSGRLPVGDISINLLGQTILFGDVNGFQINSNGGSIDAQGSITIFSGLGASGGATGAFSPGFSSVGGAAGGVVGFGNVTLAGGTAGASFASGEFAEGATGAISSIVQVQASGSAGIKGIGGGGALLPLVGSSGSGSSSDASAAAAPAKTAAPSSSTPTSIKTASPASAPRSTATPTA